MSRSLSFWLQIVRSHQSRIFLMCGCVVVGFNFCVFAVPMPVNKYGCSQMIQRVRTAYALSAIIIMNCFIHIERSSRDMKNRAHLLRRTSKRLYQFIYSTLHYDCACCCSNTFQNFISADAEPGPYVRQRLLPHISVCISFVYSPIFFFSHIFSAFLLVQMEPMTSKIRRSERVKCRTTKAPHWAIEPSSAIMNLLFQFWVIQKYFILTYLATHSSHRSL